MLAALGAGDARAAALPARRADQAARCARWPPRPGCPSPPRPSRRTCASWPAPAAPRSWPATAALERPPGGDRRPRRARARPPPRRAPLHGRPAQGPRRRRARAAVRAGHRRGREPRRGRARATALAHPHGRRARRDAAPRRGRGRRRQAALPLAPPLPCRVAAEHGRGRRGRSSWASRSTAPRPGRRRACCAGDVVVGVGDDRPRPRLARSPCDDLRRDPRDFLAFFEERDHLRLPSASLVPAQTTRPCCSPPRACTRSSRTSSGASTPPHHRLTTCQKCFRTPTSTRSARPRGTSPSSRCSATSRSATTSSRAPSSSRGTSRSTASASTPEDIWVTVFEGDDALGLGPDEEAIEAWVAIGVPRERIVAAAALGELLAGRARPARAARARSSTSTAASSSAAEDDLPGGENERFLEYWNLVFMQYDQDPAATLTPLPGAEHRHRPRASTAWR